MTATPTTNRRRRQRGGVMIEALIGLLIMSMVGGGVVYMAGRVNVTHQQMSLQDMAVREMRDLLLRHGSGGLDLCANVPTVSLPDGTELDIAVEGCALVEGSITVGEVAISLPNVSRPLILTAQSERLGLIRVGGNTDA